MQLIKTAALSLTVLGFCAGAAFADDAMMKKDAMAKPMQMSKADMKKMKACKAMSADKMAKNKGCMKMSQMHPDMMKSDGAMMASPMKK